MAALRRKFKGTILRLIYALLACLGLKVLPGSPYQRYLMPLDYLPSSDNSPRWGFSHAPIQELVELFERYRGEFRLLMREMGKLEPYFSRIPKVFLPDSLEPGWIGGPINALDSALLYYFVMDMKPSTYLEIGSGVTTLFVNRARKDHDLATRIISIDPHPRSTVDDICDEIVRETLEQADLSIFDRLTSGDIIFMDGSHRSFMNSDVTVFMIDVLPRVKNGVVIGIHDIHLPYDYPNLFKNWYWNEQYMLAVYILAKGERGIEILMPSRFMSYSVELREEMGPLFRTWEGPRDSWLEGGTLWFRKIEQGYELFGKVDPRKV